MDEKVTFSNVPTSAGWVAFLMNMECNVPVHFYNIDNTANNGRQAIKRYYKKVRENKLPPRRFSTETSAIRHSFTIIREA